ncbi:MAG: hypothetical protein H6850_04475 [Alphaproteobacteria bacterium]|nr:MAG: hypothetical protein H6850_04475 [Alphaproteobacteria bacterium]
MRLEVYQYGGDMSVHENIRSINVKTSIGEKGFLKDHMEFFGELTKGALAFLDRDGRVNKRDIEAGYVKFHNNICQVFML